MVLGVIPADKWIQNEFFHIKLENAYVLAK